MMQINDLIGRIEKNIFKSIHQNEWDKAIFDIKILITYSESGASLFFNGNKKSLSIEFNDENGKPTFPDITWQLREAMYNESPDKGTWYAMEMTITKEGRFDIKFDYDNKPEFSIPLEDLDFIKDHQKFPRNKEYMPNWLKQILERNNIV